MALYVCKFNFILQETINRVIVYVEVHYLSA